ncbi:MAG: hypothetical protein M3Q63_02280 [bacterium]|nr:hypothetical protein [bacterium]
MSLEKKLKKDIESIHLPQTEKDVLFADFQTFLKDNPVSVPSPFKLGYSTMFKYAGMFILFIMIGVTSVQAEKALPGDLLYSVKTNINENIYKVLSFTELQQIETQITLTERRLKEVSQLVAEDRFEFENSQVLRDEINKSTNIINEYIDDNQEEGNISHALNVALELQTVIRAHEKVIEEIAVKHPQNAASVLEIQDNINDQQKVVDQIVEENTVLLVKDASSDEALVENTENSLAELESTLEQSSEITTSTREVVQQAIQKGKEKVAVGNYAEAFILFEEAHQILQQIIIIEDQQDTLERY